jgi:MFS transporter, ACS family, aldohexuronate transporter
MIMDSNPAMTTIPADEAQNVTLRTWSICGLLLLATMIMYMDRLALSQQKTEITTALGLNNTDYGRLELGFGLAFAVGGIVTGLLADRISPRWFYPVVLMGWSSVGFATGWVTSYWQLFTCRVLLGFFEAGHWPCALMTAQRLLSRRHRTMGNGILQSGAALGAILTPFVVLLLAGPDPDSWRIPFRVIGALGIVWVIGWLSTIRKADLELKPSDVPAPAPDEEAADSRPTDSSLLIRRFLALGIVVIVINWFWQYLRAWMPGMLREQYGYGREEVQYFSIAYYAAADIGCLSAGFVAPWLAERGLSVHGARVSVFAFCTLLTAMSTLVVVLPASWMLLALLLVLGFGSLGQFPMYYAFSQELATRRLGRLTGTLSFLTWTATGLINEVIGRWVDRTHSYSAVTFVAGLLPALGLLAMLLLWDGEKRREAPGPLS